jgi:hypothetical protein
MVANKVVTVWLFHAKKLLGQVGHQTMGIIRMGNNSEIQ